jgi:RHS repeat-associated protein
MLNLLVWPGADLALRELPAMGLSVIRLADGSFRRISSLITSFFGPVAAAQAEETLETRLARVASIRISPFKFVGYQDQSVTFSALAIDAFGETIHGVKFTWESSDLDKLEIDEAGQATFLRPGLARITCSAGSAQAVAPVLVRPGHRPLQSDSQWLADQNGLGVDGTTIGLEGGLGGSESLLSSVMDKLVPMAFAQSCGSGGDGGDLPYDELYTEPRNLVGSPHNRVAETTRMGLVLPESSNFDFAVPIVSLGGRGLGANLTLFYNSRIWSRHGSAVTFNPVNGWPYAGFSLGFGRVITYGTDPSIKYLLIDPDGTRHFLGTAPSTGTNTIETSDGTHIRYVGNASSGELRYPDGTKVSIVLLNNRLLPTQVTDSNGNYIQVAYKSFFPWNQAIDYVTDTLGRVIQFNYDGCGALTSITAPAFGSGTRTLAQFDYQGRSLGFNFSGLTVENATYGQALQTLRHVYFPATQTGYLFSYSDYGMIYNASMRRQMSVDANGVISDGMESARTSFIYPTSGSTLLTDAPSFSERREAPAATSGSPAESIFGYSTTDNLVAAQTRTFTISRPDSSQLLLSRSTNTAATDNGLLVQSEVKSGSSSLNKTVLTYTADGGGSPQVQSATNYDNMGTPTKVDFDYNSKGAVTNRREYGFQVTGNWQVRRRTSYSYKSDGDVNYFNANLWRLVTAVFVYDTQLNTNDGDDVLVAETTYTYDNYSALGGMQSYWNYTWAPGHLTSYNTTKTVRGNITGRTDWVDVTAGTTITRLAKIDVFGNVVKAQVSCCNEKNFTFSDGNYWSRPVQIMNGSPTGTNLTSTAAYDFNTLLATSETDPNSLTMSYSYDAALRRTQVSLPTGATITTSYNDAAMTASSTTNYTEGGANKSVTSSALYNGWGQVTQSVDPANGQVNVGYDAMGRAQSQTNPFTAGGLPGPSSTFQYDGLGRPTVTTLPGGNTVQNAYSGTTRTVTDQVNRQTKQETDGLGRVIKVVEKDASGSLTQETSYTYDVLDRLVQVDQGGQVRTYKYDALGRLLFERIPEQNATINDGIGNLWSMKYTYTDFHAIATKIDARGAVITNSYDSLNRLTSVSYDTSSAPGVASTPNVTYTYDTTSSSTTKGLLLTVSVGSGYSESYGYDGFNRLSSLTHTIDGMGYTTAYQYNTISQQMQMTYPSARVVNLNHDSSGRVNSLTDQFSSSYVSGIGYNSAEQVTGWTLGNGVAESFGYDSNRLQMTSQSATRSGTTLMSLTYGYNALAGQNGTGSTAGNSGQLMGVSGTINGTTESASYTYDLVGRLATSNQTSNGASAQRRFAYDRWGNRTGVWNATSGGTQIQTITLQQSGGLPTNRIATVNSTSYSYDSAGNMTNDGAHSYTYDAENRVVSVDGGAATYSYDQRNWRVKKSVGSGLTHYVWEGGQVLAEHNGSTGTVIVDYIYAAGRMIAKQESGVRRYFLSDRLSVRMTLDTSGNVVGRQAHLPFGEDFAESGTQQKHHLTSYERDAESGMDYAVNRYHNSSVGRFSSVDPIVRNIADPQSLNRYSYVQNDPINLVDPDGRLLAVPFINFSPDLISSLQSFFAPIRLSTTESYLSEGGGGGFIGGGPTVRGPMVGPDPDIGGGSGFSGDPERQPKRPCPEIPETPPGESVDKNIQDLLNLRKTTENLIRNGGYPASALTSVAIAFYNNVKPGGPQDYKTRGPQYEPLGNFNYGAVGAAAGFDLQTLLRAAGYVAQNTPGSDRGPGDPGSVIDILLGRGGTAPFGDMVVDQRNIRKGYKYYKRKYVRQNCP